MATNDTTVEHLEQLQSEIESYGATVARAADPILLALYDEQPLNAAMGEAVKTELAHMRALLETFEQGLDALLT